MTIHSLVYIVLSVLSLVAVHAIGSPVSKPDEQQQDVAGDTEGAEADHGESLRR